MNRPFISLVNSYQGSQPYGPCSRSTTKILAPGIGRLSCAVASKTTPVKVEPDGLEGVGAVDGDWLQLATTTRANDAPMRMPAGAAEPEIAFSARTVLRIEPPIPAGSIKPACFLKRRPMTYRTRKPDVGSVGRRT